MASDLGSREIDLNFNWRQNQFNSAYSVNQLKHFLENQKKIQIDQLNKPSAHQLFLSVSQRAVFQHVEKFIKKPILERKQKSLKILIVSIAGGGKTALLNCIADLLEKHNIGHQKIAFTGTASSGIYGKTIHSVFNLSHKCGNFNELAKSESVSYVASENFRDVEFVLIEEYFLLSPALLNFINLKLQHIFKNTLPFGNRSVVCAGDCGQLFPLFYGVLYAPVDSVPEEQQAGIRLHNEFRVFKLDSSFRQKDDVRFQELLSNFRFKKVTSDDVKLLETRLFKNISAEEKTKFDTATRLYSINRKVNSYNREKIASLNVPILKVASHQSPPTPLLIPEFVFVGRHIRVSLTRDLDIARGLYWGAQGSIESWVFDSHRVTVVLVRFDTYRYGTVNGLVPVPRIADYVWNPIIRRNIKVWSFPLVNAYATTIHKAQGLTLPLAVTSFGSSEQFVNQSYVVLSRVRRLTDIVFEDDQLFLKRFTDYSFMRQAAIILQEYMRLGIYPILKRRLSTDSSPPLSPNEPPNKIQKSSEDGDAK
jgi:ATP-dependent DNA helicase PIF1